ncbi:hypothetical protein ACQKGO_05130 [Corallococcus interemptor]|uniref:hypothetical protein n=1 Tax=Corallococcus interemptor TaxID=2316720 RepID=UPI003D075B8E
MKLLGRDIPTGALVARIEERLRVRGLPTSEPAEVPEDGVEPRVDPLTFNMHALEENADTTRALPLHTHRGGMGQAVLVAKWAFRKTCQVLINETLGRQRVFNGLVRDSYAQLSAEVIRLRQEVDTLRAQAAKAQPPEAPRPPKPPPAVSHGRPAPRATSEEEAESAARRQRPLPAIDYGRPSKPPHDEQARPAKAAHEEHGRPPKPPHSDQGRPPKSPPEISHGRPPKPAHEAQGRPSKQGRPPKPSASPESPRHAGQQRRPPKPPREAQALPVQPSGATATGPAERSHPPAPPRIDLGSSSRAATTDARGRPARPAPSKKARSTKPPQRPEGSPRATAPRSPRSKQGGPKKR